MGFKRGNRAAKGAARPPGRRAGVTPQMERFAREYVIDLDGGRAAVAAGYTCTTRANSQTKASHLLKRPDVAALVATLKGAQVQRLDLKADDVLREVMRLASLDPGRLFDSRGKMLPIAQLPEDVRRCIASIEYDQLGQATKIRFWSKTDALGMIGKHFKLFVDRLEVKISDRASALARARARLAAAATTTPAPGAASSP